MIHDIEIVDILDSQEKEEFTGSVWRTTWHGRSAILGGMGGGRWSLPNSCETLYSSLEIDTSIHELHYHLSQAPVFSSSSVDAHEIKINDLELLNLTTPDVLEKLHIDAQNSTKDQMFRCQQVGAAAYFLGYQAIFVPSFRNRGVNCVIFSERLNVDQLEVLSSKPINWPGWIKKNIKRRN